jgi:hypothetical protein
VSEYDREASKNEEVLVHWGCGAIGKKNLKILYKHDTPDDGTISAETYVGTR